jgi:hypothetical protein
MMPNKIGAHHLERKAILYIRQSSAHQVLHNRESSALQYAMGRVPAGGVGGRQSACLRQTRGGRYGSRLTATYTTGGGI